MSDISQLQPAILLRKNENDNFDLVLRWVPEDPTWLPRSKDVFKLEIAIKYATGTKYIQEDGTIVDAEPTGNDVPLAKPDRQFMLDPPRQKAKIPFSDEGQSTTETELTHWLKGKKPTKDVDCGLEFPEDQFPIESEGFGVCHLLDNAQASKAAWKAYRAALPMISEALDEYENHMGDSTQLSKAVSVAKGTTTTLRQAKVAAVAKSLAIYLAGRTVLPDVLQNSPQQPRFSVPAINAGFKELEALSKQSEQKSKLAAKNPISWRQNIFNFSVTDSAQLGQITTKSLTTSQADQIAFRYEYAAIISKVLGNSKNRKLLEDSIKGPEQARRQIRLRALQGGSLLDFRNKKIANSSEIIGLGRTFTDIPEAEVEKWEQVDLKVEHVPAVVDQDSDSKDLLNSMYDTFTIVNGGSTVTNRLKSGSVDSPLTETQIASAITHGTSFPPTAPKFVDVDDADDRTPPEPRINFDLVQSDVTQPEGTNPELDPPQSKHHVGYNTGDGKLELLMRFETDPGDTQFAGGFNVYVMWEPDSGPLKSFFEPWASGHRDKWLRPDLRILKPTLATRRYSYLQDLRGSLDGDAILDQLMEKNPPKQTLFQRPDEVEDLRPIENGQSRDDVPHDEEEPELPSAVMPNEINKGFSLWTLDVRKGMKSPYPAEYVQQWDPSGIINFNWDPTKKRDGNGVTGKPQAYRLWVTTVDFFEQESEPVPVYCKDPASSVANESEHYLFYPLRRAPIEAPPGEDSAADPTVKARTLEIKTSSIDNHKLKIEWSTPFHNQIGSGLNRTDDVIRLNKNDLQAHIVIFRKMLHRNLDSSGERTLKRTKYSQPTIPALPQWEQAVSELVNEGWQRFGDHITIDGRTMSNDVWSHTQTLRHFDRGFDYIALLGVEIKPASDTANYYAPNSIVSAGGERQLQFVNFDSEQGKYVHGSRPINETPQASSVEKTKPPKDDLNGSSLRNEDRPRGVSELVVPDFGNAKPVLPPPYIQRDFTLSKIATFEFEDSNGKLEKQPWYHNCEIRQPKEGEQEVEDIATHLTLGQIAMIESSLARTTGVSNICVQDLLVARKLMAEDFKLIDAEEPGYRQHPTIGFRGLKYLEWTYDPLLTSETSNIKRDESEATSFRIYQVRVEKKPSSARNYASVIAKANLIEIGDGKFECQLSPREAGSNISSIRPIICGEEMPALVRIEPTARAREHDYRGEYAWFGVIESVESKTPANACESTTSEITRATITVRMENKPAGFPAGPIEAWLYIAQPQIDLKIESHELTELDTKVALPVGGGPAEVFAWWIGTISAQERECGHERRKFNIQHMRPTVEPTSPEFLRVAPPVDPVEHNIDKDKEEETRWLPESLKEPTGDPNLIEVTPHIVLTWAPYTVASEVGIKIQRERREVQKESNSKRLLKSVLSPWEAIKLTQDAPDGTALHKDWLEILTGENGWLLGEPVSADDDIEFSPSSEFKLLVDAAAGSDDFFLNGHTGIKQVVPPAGGLANHACYLDYRKDVPSEGEGPLNTNYECRYKLTPYLDLGSGLPNSFRYLFGKPSGITNWQDPQNPRIMIKPKVHTAIQASEHDGPIVSFTFNHSLVKSILNAETNDNPTDWRYRIVVRRKLPFSLKADPIANTQLGFEDIGSGPLSFFPKTPTVQLIDKSIERSDPDEELSLDYHIFISQFAIYENGVERLVRGTGVLDDEGNLHENGYELNVTVDAPDNSTVEVKVPVSINFL